MDPIVYSISLYNNLLTSYTHYTSYYTAVTHIFRGKMFIIVYNATIENDLGEPKKKKRLFYMKMNFW